MESDKLGSSVMFGESTMIVRYLEKQVRNYDNHKKVMRELYSKNRYPRMRQYFLKKVVPQMKYDFLIVKTGSREEFLRKASISDLKEAIDAVIPGGTFADIHGEGNVADTADSGQYITDMSEFRRLRSAVEGGAYSIEEVLEY